MPSTIICLLRSYHIQMTAHLIHLWLCLSQSPWSEVVSLFQHSDKVYFEPCIWCYSHIALDSNLSNLFYYISIILNIWNCKSQDRLGYGTLPRMTKLSGCKCKCIILSALNLASTASSSATRKAASYNSKGNRKVSRTLVSELLPEVAHDTHFICSQLTCKQSNWSRVTSRRASLVAQLVKNPPSMQERPWFNPWFWKIPWRRQLTPVFLPGEFHGWRSLAGYSPWGHKRGGHNLATKQQQQQLQEEDGCRKYGCTQRRKESVNFTATFLMFKQYFLRDFSKPEGWMYSVQAVSSDF